MVDLKIGLTKQAHVIFQKNNKWPFYFLTPPTTRTRTKTVLQDQQMIVLVAKLAVRSMLFPGSQNIFGNDIEKDESL